MDNYTDIIDNMEEIVANDNIYPVVRNKRCCFSFLELCKVFIQYFKNLKYNINASKKD